MQVFIVGTVLETAQCLDSKRLHKQIIECKQILKAISGETNAWINHPIVHMYKNHSQWLRTYMWILEEWSQPKSDILMLMHLNEYCIKHKPDFINFEYVTNMKKRLFTKDKNHYKQWESLGESNVNYYFVDGMWKKYIDGKLISIDETIS